MAPVPCNILFNQTINSYLIETIKYWQVETYKNLHGNFMPDAMQNGHYQRRTREPLSIDRQVG